MRLLTAGLLAGLCACPGLSARAEGLKLSEVSADAKCVAHADVDAMHKSVVVGKSWDKLLEITPGARERLEKVGERLGFAGTNDIHGITVYGKVLGDKNGVMIVHAKIDKAKLEALADKADEHNVTEDGSHRIHTWTETHRGKKRSAAGAIRGDDTLVLAKTADAVKAALAVLDGKSAGMAEDGPLRGKSFPGAIALFRVTGVSSMKLPGDPPLAKQVDSYRVTVGENDGKSFYRAHAVLVDEDAAKQAKTVLEGLRAFGLLHVRGDAQGKAIVDASTIRVEGKDVMVGVEASVDDVWDQIVKHGKVVIEQHKKHRDAGR